MSSALLDSGDRQPFIGARIVILAGVGVGEMAHITGVHSYYSALAGEPFYTVLTEDGQRLVGSSESFEVSIYQNEPLEAVPNV